MKHKKKLIGLAAAAAIVGGIVPITLADTQFTHTDNPIEIGPRVQVPNSQPTTVTLLQDQDFAYTPPQSTTTTLPTGHWSKKGKVTAPKGKFGKVILTITGTEKGTQYDRLLNVWAGNTQIFTGVTPEPSTDGISWKVQKDVSEYLPVLSGDQTFTIQLDNYTSDVYTGVPNVTVTLSYYPETGNDAKADPWALPTPDKIVPVVNDPTYPTNDWIHPGQAINANVSLPNDITSAYLDLYAVGQNVDEFAWANQPAFREVEVLIDGQPAGAVWPYPYIYTGGVNPLLWRPITGLHTMNIPSYRVDLTPFAGLLGGKHTVTVKVADGQEWWDMSGSLMLYEGGTPTTGKILKNTLTFPTQAPYDTSQALGSSDNQLMNQTANTNYEIQGEIDTNDGQHYTSTVDTSLNYSNDQTNITQNYWQIVHAAQITNTTSTLTGPNGKSAVRSDKEQYNLDGTSAFMQPSDNKGYFLPADVTQTFDSEHTLSGNGQPYHSTLHESIQGYAAYQKTDTKITQGATYGYADFEDSLGNQFHQWATARGGQLVQNEIQSNMQLVLCLASLGTPLHCL